jgi:hypothetical protein
MVGYAQHKTQVLDSDIRTLRMRYMIEALEPSGMVSRPYLVLPESGVIDGSDEENALEISFDEMSHDVHQYSYRVLHCNREWKESDISSYEYVDGFTTADIVDYEHSMNTQQAYTHYSFAFPNEDMQLKASGNYVVQIYEDGDQEQVVAVFYFQVVEPMVEIEANVRANTDVELNGRYQQVDIDVHTEKLGVRDASDVALVVQQNGRMDNQQYILRPTFIEPQKLRYVNKKELIFEGGNEFRRFDSYSRYYAGYNVNSVSYDQGEYHVLLEADRVRGTEAKGAGREGLSYLSDVDANGQLVVNCERSDFVDTEAEYMWVHFVLPVERPLMNAQVFVGGDLFFNRYSVNNMMQYDAENKCYYLYAYLKQGGYNYMYYTLRDGAVSMLPLEGSHWQTQNEYTVDVYYSPFGARYDRLVGKKITR